MCILESVLYLMYDLVICEGCMTVSSIVLGCTENGDNSGGEMKVTGSYGWGQKQR